MPENNIQQVQPTQVTLQSGADAAIKSAVPPVSILKESEAPKKSFSNKFSAFMHNKGLMIGAVAVVIAVVVSVSVLFGFNANNQYQGLIKKIEQDTVDLNSNL